MNKENRVPPAYDINRSYDENYEQGPFFPGSPPEIAQSKKKYSLLDFELNSPIGIPAGLLLNARWVSLYCRLGFDILTYKTVRSKQKNSHPLPNCLFLETTGTLSPEKLPASMTAATSNPDFLKATITNSFGMPSKEPEIWQEDVELAKKSISKGQVLIVSVVGGAEGGWRELVKDFERTACMAKDAGGDIVELNLSCPNISSAAGELYKDTELTSKITAAVKKAIHGTPLFIKTGFYEDAAVLAGVLKANINHIEGIVGVNSVKMKVVDRTGRAALDEKRIESGICGAAIAPFAKKFIQDARSIRKREGYPIAIISTGGIMTPGGFDQHIAMGADAALSCTGAMLNPLLAASWKMEKFYTQNPAAMEKK